MRLRLANLGQMKDLFADVQVGGDDQRVSFVELADQVEQQCSARGNPGRGPSSEPGQRRNGLSEGRRG